MCPRSIRTDTNPSQPDPLLSIAEAAAQARVHVQTMRGFIRAGELSVIRLSARALRIRQSELEAWLERSTERRAG